MDEGLNSTDDPPRLPRGVAVQHTPGESPGLWFEVAELPDGRLGMAIGDSPDCNLIGRLRSTVRTALLRDPDPAAALTAVEWPGSTALCAVVIDQPASQMTCATLGGLAAVAAGPGSSHRVVQPAAGTVLTTPLSAGTTVLLSTGPADQTAARLAECVNEHPEQAAAHIAAALNPPSPVLLYRQPPGPLQLTLPARPASLAVIRGRLRRWLALAGVDPETSADALLAVGEATANATEHSAAGVSHEVELTVHAAIAGERLRFIVSDNGCWKPARSFPRHRGHGIKLIEALVDAADFTTGERGTTVEMLKEVRA